MRHLPRRVLSLSLILILLVAFSDLAAAANDRPVKMSEVARLIKDQSPQDVLAAMADRGVGFRVSSGAEGRLKKYGFTQDQIELIKKIASGEAVDLDAGPADADGDEAGGADNADAFKVGFPDPEHWHISEQKRIERAIKNAGLGYKRIELTRATLYCNAARAGKLAPLLKKLEGMLIKRFPASIASASSPRSAHIVIVDGVSEWSNWVDALMDSYEKDGMKFSFGPEADTKTHLKNTSGFFLPALATAHADLRSDENVARFSTYALGHLMMARAGGKDQPAGLTTGFGDLAEAMAMKTPSVMIYSYEKRDLKQEGGWKEVVKKLFEAKKIDNATAPWGYTTDSMKPENYAECWSMVSTLAEAPDKFAKAVRMVREDKKFMNVAVNEVYGMQGKDLLKAWYKWVSQ
ncbi:MAG: hypothetical protein KTR15_12185 [Phycisphaeraceae bacterium]|nr:hypothetical protein [Phycisphaeraceae bacterium]